MMMMMMLTPLPFPALASTQTANTKDSRISSGRDHFGDLPFDSWKVQRLSIMITFRVIAKCNASILHKMPKRADPKRNKSKHCNNSKTFDSTFSSRLGHLDQKEGITILDQSWSGTNPFEAWIAKKSMENSSYLPSTAVNSQKNKGRPFL